MAANSGDHAPPSTNCYSAILRRLLCSGSLPTHPSDQFLDPTAEKHFKPEENVGSNPGVVARLMGLDPFPSTAQAQRDKTLGSFFRSRSVNSIDFVSHFDSVKQHRRVRTSVSFREGINYLEKVDGERENEKEKRGGSENSEKLRERRVIKKGSEKRVEIEIEEGRRTQKKDLHGGRTERMKEKRRVVKRVKCEEEMVQSKCSMKRQNRILARKVHSGCKVHPERVVPGRVSSTQNPPPQIAKTQSQYSNKSHFRKGELRAIPKGIKKERKLANNKESCYYRRMVEIICGLTEESVKQMNEDFEVTSRFDEFEEICKQFGHEILESLLVQFVDELVR